MAEGELPDGRAVMAYNEDLGAPRVPTFCRFRLSASLPEPGPYRMILETGPPLELTAGEGRTLVVIP